MQTILITGASSGIGEALALDYAAPDTILAITGRDALRLEAVASACREKGAEVVSFVGDVRERERLSGWILELDARHPVDLVIANAGVIAGMTGEHAIEEANAAYELLQINILGAANTVQPLIPRMMARRSGQIALMSSIAAFVPLAHAPSYSASKAAILNYGKSLRDALLPHGVKVSVVCPGFVETRMSLAEKGPKPFMVSPAKAAKLIRAGLARNREIVTFPRFFSFVTWLSGLLPSPIRRAVSRPFEFSVRDKRG
ncbi:MAG TPA: SDR family NAD(P)-dependent oxidoreductase [Xanthobacteraceae bacterium]|nr:SDR family NAD(P)-dependent oxidoreductase [Xanthobacteraceae bacterium]